MEGTFLDGQPISAEEAEAYRAEHFGGALTNVSQPWASHGPALQVGGVAYFKGNARDATDKCGNDQLQMNLLSITPNGTCPIDGLVSYTLIPADNVTSGGS
jgi:hypothetical protein